MTRGWRKRAGDAHVQENEGVKRLQWTRRALTEVDGKAFVTGDGRLRGVEPFRAALTSSARMSLFSSTAARKRPADAVGGPAVLQMATWRFVRRARSRSSCCYCGPSAASRPAGRWPAAVSPASWHGGWLFLDNEYSSFFPIFHTVLALAGTQMWGCLRPIQWLGRAS